MSGSARNGDSVSSHPHRRSVRSRIVEQIVDEAVRDQITRSGREHLNVLDAGGGTGTVAVPLAEDGHVVTVVDPSPESLAGLERRAAEAGVGPRIRAYQGDTSNLLDIVPPAGADLVFCHNVLEFVEDPDLALTAMASATRPGGGLSVIVANRYAVVLAKALAGHLGDARTTLTGRHGPARFTPEELDDLLARAGYSVVARHGVPVFADIVPATSTDRRSGSDGMSALLALEQAVSEHRAFREIGTHLHVLGHLET